MRRALRARRMRRYMQKLFIGGRAVASLPQAEAPEQKAYVIHDAATMSLASLRVHLCAVGSGQCATCQLCAYGREYARRIIEGVGPQNPKRQKTYEADLQRSKNQRIQRRAAGLCTYCGKRPPVPGRVTCQKCLEVMRERKRAQQEAKKFEKEGLQDGT